MQAQLDFKRCLALSQVQTVSHPEDMCIHRNGGTMKSQTGNDIGCLAADAWQFQQSSEIFWDFAAIFFRHDTAGCHDILGLITK
jgi:hypothetical protein